MCPLRVCVLSCLVDKIHLHWHYGDVTIGAMASQIIGLSTVCSTVRSGARHQRNHESSTPLAVLMGIHWWPVNSPHKGPVTPKMFYFRLMTSSWNDELKMWPLNNLFAGFSRADSWFVPSQWETVLLCNDVSHWQGASLESALVFAHWKPSITIMITFSSLAAPHVVITTISGAKTTAPGARRNWHHQNSRFSVFPTILVYPHFMTSWYENAFRFISILWESIGHRSLKGRSYGILNVVFGVRQNLLNK